MLNKTFLRCYFSSRLTMFSTKSCHLSTVTFYVSQTSRTFSGKQQTTVNSIRGLMWSNYLGRDPLKVWDSNFKHSSTILRSFLNFKFVLFIQIEMEYINDNVFSMSEEGELVNCSTWNLFQCRLGLFWENSFQIWQKLTCFLFLIASSQKRKVICLFSEL